MPNLRESTKKLHRLQSQLATSVPNIVANDGLGTGIKCPPLSGPSAPMAANDVVRTVALILGNADVADSEDIDDVIDLIPDVPDAWVPAHVHATGADAVASGDPIPITALSFNEGTFTIVGDGIEIPLAGTYQFVATVNFEFEQGDNYTVAFEALKNGAAFTANSTATPTLAVQFFITTSLTLVGLVEFAVGDDLTVEVTTSDARATTVNLLTVNLNRVSV